MEEPENDLPDQLKVVTPLQDVPAVDDLYRTWFLDYASYVILERAVPAVEDGLKPVQRRILHSMREMEDGRYNKVANIIGQTMQYHPHGDAAIGDAIVSLGQKNLLIDTQGNWGDVNTGDSAAAPRYIEARLSKFALEVLFNPAITKWQLSYDGRKQEPITLPAKFPILLAQGVEGIAVGLSTKILPHNFNELIEAAIAHLRGKEFEIFPDFQTGGQVDISNYNAGKRGGRIRLRAQIEEADKQTLHIRSIPYGSTTSSLIESIVKANDAGKIKIRKISDNTAAQVEIEIQLHKGVSPDLTIDALYAFTDCESSISPNACVIVQGHPQFLTVDEILRININQTKQLLQWELEIKKGLLEDDWHFSSLEKIFIENRIYRDIEQAETWQQVLDFIATGLAPHLPLLRREVTTEDIARLTEIKIKRISKFDAFKADEHIRSIEEQLEGVAHSLANITAFAIDYFKGLQKRFGKGRERKTEIRAFDNIQAKQVVLANEKLYIDRAEGFIGLSLKKEEFICECSTLDDIIIFRRDGKMLVTRVAEKIFVGKNIEYVGVWRNADDRMTYNMIYADDKGIGRAKRFNVIGVTRDKEYDLTSAKGKVLYFSANPNSEAEVVSILLHPAAKAKSKEFDYDFASLAIKGRISQGNIVTKHPIKKIQLKERGASTLGGRAVYYDAVLGRLNVDDRGKYLGEFDQGDLILAVYNDGTYELTSHELTNRYESAKLAAISKLTKSCIVTAIYADPQAKATFAKRFRIETSTVNKPFSFIPENGSKLLLATLDTDFQVEYAAGSRKGLAKPDRVIFSGTEDVRGWKAQGKKISSEPFFEIRDVLVTPKTEEIDKPMQLIPDAEVTPTPPDSATQPEDKTATGATKQRSLF